MFNFIRKTSPKMGAQNLGLPLLEVGFFLSRFRMERDSLHLDKMPPLTLHPHRGKKNKLKRKKGPPYQADQAFTGSPPKGLSRGLTKHGESKKKLSGWSTAVQPTSLKSATFFQRLPAAPSVFSLNASFSSGKWLPKSDYSPAAVAAAGGRFPEWLLPHVGRHLLRFRRMLQQALP